MRALTKFVGVQMKMATTLICCLLLTLALSCKTEEMPTLIDEDLRMLDLNNYKQALSTELSSGNFRELQKIVNLDKATVQNAVYDGKNYKYFEVPIYQGTQPKAVILTLIGREKYYNMVFWLKEEDGKGTGIIDVKTTSNEAIGVLKIKNMRISHIDVAQETSTGARVARSWWACTTDCAGDVTVACGSSSDCTVLMTVSNLIGATTGRAGMGTLSVWASCGIACGGNSDMDLLPQY
jgi:hypothetical protein